MRQIAADRHLTEAEDSRPGRPTTRLAVPVVLASLALLLSLIALYFALGDSPPRVLHLWLSSDTLYPVNVTTDVVKDRYPLSGWRFSIAPCWFPDLFACGIFWILTRNVILATCLAGFIQLPLIVGVFALAGWAIGFRRTLQYVLLSVVSVAITLYVAAHPGITYPDLYRFFEPQSHVGSLILSLCAFALALLILRRTLADAAPARILQAAYFSVCLLAGMSNLMFFPQMLVPLTVALALAASLGVLTWAASWMPAALGWPAAIIGAILNRTLFHTTDVSAESKISADRALTCLDLFMRGFVSQTLSGQFLHLLALGWLLVCLGAIIVYLRKVIRRGPSVGAEPRLRLLYFLFWLLSALASVGAIVVGGSNGLAEFHDYLWTTHYLQSLFFVPLFGLPLVAASLLDHEPLRRFRHAAALVVSVAALAAPMQALAQTGSPPAPLSRFEPPLVRHLDQLSARDGLRYGFAGYWQARVITLLSSAGLRVYPIDGSLRPLLWVSNIYWYSEQLDDRTKPPPVDFVLLDDPLWKISRESVVAALGQPVSEEKFEGTRILVYRTGSH